MKKIKSIKDIVTSPLVNDGEEVHFIGEIITKKNHSHGKYNWTTFLVNSGNFCIDCMVDNQYSNYKELLNEVKIGKIRYFEGKVGGGICGIKITITNVSSNVILKKLEHEKESLEIKFLKYIYSNDEDAAVNLLKSNPELNTNYEFSNKLPLFLPVNSGFEMSKLFNELVNDPKTDIRLHGAFGEPVLIALIYTYCGGETQKNIEYREYIEKLINIILNCERYDFNLTDINVDTPIYVACCQNNDEALWIIKALVEKENVDLNIINDINETVLGNCIRNENIKALKIIATRKDLIVRDEDRELAKEHGINLSEYGLV